MPKISVARLRELLNYDPQTGAFTWRVDRSHNARAGQPAGCIDSMGYVQLTIDDSKVRGHCAAWAITHGEFVELVDHINENRSDNRLSNLRQADKSLNGRNRSKLNARNTSGVRGVHWDKQHGKWHAQIKPPGQRLQYIGLFTSLEDAAKARRAAEIEIGGYPCANGPLRS